MEISTAKRPHRAIGDDLAVLGSFLIFGSLSGFLFAWSTAMPSLQQFFFIRYDKFVVPRYPYWFALSVLQTLGLSTAYSFCKRCQWLFGSRRTRTELLVSLMVGLAAPFAYLTVVLLGPSLDLDPVWQYLVGSFMFVVWVSIALSTLTHDRKLLPIAIIWNILFIIAGWLILFGLARTTKVDKVWLDFIVWPVLYGMLGLSFGNWIIWRK
jgi:hypothetical protein